MKVYVLSAVMCAKSSDESEMYNQYIFSDILGVFESQEDAIAFVHTWDDVKEIEYSDQYCEPIYVRDVSQTERIFYFITEKELVRKSDTAYNEQKPERSNSMDYILKNKFNSKEEMLACLHEMLEWTGPIRESIQNTAWTDCSTEECTALSKVQIVLEDLDKALSELDRVASI